ncbi:aspartic peptidase domain-containing protein [Rhodocollybia butyracea]|uniref:Aspartic peptidase domain-containing protein n=1 Tax=Rhodocollybia butyracea TaxID=206335 RepID=A0A9P5P4Y4_9AGAR|nr:aspartic peptidase domain-containing protein [Rhodocollybia butyracea]
MFNSLFKARAVIPFINCGSITKPDRSFDLDKALAKGIALRNKYRQNLINFQRNTGCLPQGWQIKQAVRYAEQLVYRGNEWTGYISIRTPPQQFLINIDMPLSSCVSPACSGKLKYKACLSLSSIKQPGSFSIKYADCSRVSGSIFKDTVAFGGVKVTEQCFLAVTAMSAEFTGSLVEGILGLGFPLLSNLHAEPFIQSAYAQGAIPRNKFSLCLGSAHSTNSELFLGGTNSTLYKDPIHFNAHVILAGFDTIIDSGTTIIYGPPTAVEKFYSTVPGAQRLGIPGTKLFYCVLSNSIPDVLFSWGGKSFAITKENFSLGTVEPGYTIGVITADLDISVRGNLWLLGNRLVFLQNVYTVFSFECNAIGFANLA